MLVQPETTSVQHDHAHPRINLADFAIGTDVLGPGRRVVIWVQGCPRRCPGCITASMQRFDIDREWLTPKELARRIVDQLPLEGLTFVGGEPFSHARALAEAARIARAQADLSVVTYTGHTFERIRALGRPDWQALLDVTDLLIDGEYVEALNDGLLWRGSSNQRIHVLTPRYQALAQAVADRRERALEFSIDGAGSLRIVGTPESGFLPRLLAQLRTRGIHFADNETNDG